MKLTKRSNHNWIRLWRQPMFFR